MKDGSERQRVTIVDRSSVTRTTESPSSAMVVENCSTPVSPDRHCYDVSSQGKSKQGESPPNGDLVERMAND